MAKVKDLNGQRFGKLIATNQIKRHGNKALRLCKCDCGKETWVQTHSLIIDHTKSCGCGKSLEIGRAAQNSLMLDYKHGARKRHLDWSLSFEDFIILTTSRCYFCGCEPHRIKSKPSYNGHFIYNGIDRLNNDRGYDTNNCVTCCWICNNAKGTLSLDEFLQWIKAIKSHDIK